MTRRPLIFGLVMSLALLGAGCSADDVAGTVKQCAEVGAAVAKVSAVAAGAQVSGRNLDSARDALVEVNDVPESLRGAFETLERSFAEGKGFDDPTVTAAFEEIGTWVANECLLGNLGNRLPGN